MRNANQSLYSHEFLSFSVALFLVDGPEDTAPDEVVKDRILVILFAVAEGKVDLAAAIEGLEPGQGQGIWVAVRLGAHLFEASEFGSIGGQERVDTGAEVIGEVALIGPGEVGRAGLVWQEKLGSATWMVKVCRRGCFVRIFRLQPASSRATLALSLRPNGWRRSRGGIGCNA